MEVEAIIEVNGEEVRRIDISSYVESVINVTDADGLGREIESELDGTSV